ncbi:MAG: hypothetical protein AAF638_02165 [Pseudomonadota bacterium]
MKRAKPFLITSVLTVAMAYGCYWLWGQIPGWIRGTPVSDFRQIVSVVAVFLALSLAEPVLIRIWRLLVDRHA